MINPRHLRAFLAVAQVGSVIGSADRVQRAQSVVTRSIKELEKSLGVALFERHPRGMSLTEFGRVLLTRAENVFFEMSAARDAFGDLCEEPRWNANAPIFVLGLGRMRLLVFVELMRQWHMGAVADHFGISQPAVSQALREMEQGLGVALMVRSPSGIRPNALGTLLAVHLRRSLAEIAKAEEEIASLQQGMTGHVAVGTLSLARNQILPKAIIRMARDYPNIFVSTLEGDFEHLTTLLRADEIDLIIGGLRPSEHMVGLGTQTVAEDRIALIMRADHPLARLRHSNRHRLNGARWILPIPGTWTRNALETALEALELEPPQVAVESADVQITRSLLLDSNMVTAASANLFRQELDSGELIVAPIKLPSPPREIGIIQRVGSSPSSAAKILMNAVIEGIDTRGPVG